MTRKELELALVRVAERWPDRVAPALKAEVTHSGNWATLVTHARGDKACIIGQVCFDAGYNVGMFPGKGKVEEAGIGDDLWPLAAAAMTLNDGSVPWGEIVKQLGLVPGEQPAEVVEPTLLEVS